MYNIANVGWQLVHYTVYGTQKSDNGRSEVESIIAFLRPVNCIVDELPSNICIMFWNEPRGGALSVLVMADQYDQRSTYRRST